MTGSAEKTPTILFLSSPATAPQASVSGTAMISLALMKTFTAAGWMDGFSSFVKADKWQADNATPVGAETSAAGQLGRVWYAKRTSAEENAHEFRKIVDECKPDIVYSYGHEAADIANRARGDYNIEATFYDPPCFFPLQALDGFALRRHQGEVECPEQGARYLPALAQRVC